MMEKMEEIKTCIVLILFVKKHFIFVNVGHRWANILVYMMIVSYFQEFPHQVVDCDPSIQPFFLSSNDRSILEVEGQRTQIYSETCQDFIGPRFIFKSLKAKKRITV